MICCSSWIQVISISLTITAILFTAISFTQTLSIFTFINTSIHVFQHTKLSYLKMFLFENIILVHLLGSVSKPWLQIKMSCREISDCFSMFLDLIICFRHSLESSQWDDSNNKYPQDTCMFIMGLISKMC